MNKFSFCQEFCEALGIKTLKNASLKEYTSFRIGGAAKLLAEPKNERQLSDLLCFLQKHEISNMVIGRGSNLLFSDNGYNGVIIHLGSNYSGLSLVDSTTIECLSGTSLTELCKFALSSGLSGLEFAYGIPGTVGGAVYMNAGAYGGEIKDVLSSTYHLDTSGTEGSFSIDGLHMGYRQSIYSGSGLVITKARFSLQPGIAEEIQAKMNDYMSRRREKQPLELPSAGSVFRRPQGNYASALIDQCGLKGYQIGAAQVSEKHAGFIVNLGSATCLEVLELISYIQNCVREKTGYNLECEIKAIV